MKQYVGNCGDVIDWNAVVESVANSKPAYQGPRHTKNDDLKLILTRKLCNSSVIMLK